MRRLVLALTALGLLASALPTAGLPPGGLYGGELRVALQAQPSLDPLQFAGNRLVQELAFDSLTRIGTDQLPKPSLAATWVPNAGAGTITFDLRAATWPDRTPITAQDVAWSYGKHLAGGSATGFTAAPVDADTVRFTFTSGGGDFLGNAASLPVAWKDLSNTVTSNGPFVLAGQTPAATDLAANDRHWNGRPYLDRISFRHPFTLVRNPDGTTRADDAACALLKGQVHLIGWPVSQNDLTTERDCSAGFGGWSDGTNRTLLNPDPTKTMPHAAASEDPGLRVMHLGMNTTRAPLTQPVFRQALSRALDRDLIAGTFGGAIEPKTDIADSVVSRANFAWYNESVPLYRVERVVIGTTVTPSLEKVNAFLDETGYLDTDGDGWRQDPAGAPFSFTLLTLDSRTDPRVAKYLDMITKFQAIGVNVTQQEETPTDLRAKVASGAFDLYVDVMDVGGEPSFLFDLFHSTGRKNLARIASPALDAILERARDAIDPVVRRQSVREAQGWVAVNVPLAPIVHQRAVHSYDRLTFEGWVHGLGGIANFWSLTSVRVTQRGPLVVRVDAVDATVRSGAQTTVLVRVQDSTDDPVEGVEIELTGVGLSALAGTTDAQGLFVVEFTAPDVAAPEGFPITVNASKPGYAFGAGAETVTVHPVVRSFSFSLSKDDASMPSGNRTHVRVTVYDASSGAPVAGANVTFAASPDGLAASFDPASGETDAAGEFETTFTADVAIASRFQITATVRKAGYVDERATTSVEVSPRSQGNVPVTPALDTISMVLVVAGMAALFGAWQRRKWVARKP